MRVLAFLLAFSIFPGISHAGNSFIFEGEILGDIDKIDFNEPSGIVFHPLRKTLFAVGDEGDICEIATDGTPIKSRHIRHADFEGITCVPETGLLYVAVEGEEKILEIDPENFSVLREFNIGRVFKGKTVLKKGGNGIEAITFVPDYRHPEGGTFYLTNQSFDAEEEPSAVFEVELPLKDRNKQYAEILRFFPFKIMSLSGLYYDRERDRIYVISSLEKLLLEMDKDGTILTIYYDLPGFIQEGITMDDEGFLYIAQDSGGILKVRWKRQEGVY